MVLVRWAIISPVLDLLIYLTIIFAAGVIIVPGIRRGTPRYVQVLCGMVLVALIWQMLR